MWDWQEPAAGAARWGSDGMAYMADGLFLIAALCSAAVGWAFWRDYSDASPITRGYFYALMWKRAAATVLFLSYLVMDINPYVGVFAVLVSVAAYDIVSAIFLFVWSRKGKTIKADESIGGAVRKEGRGLGIDWDSLDEAQTLSVIKRGLAAAFDKAAAGNSNIH